MEEICPMVISDISRMRAAEKSGNDNINQSCNGC